MIFNRRVFLKTLLAYTGLGALLKPVFAWAEWNIDAFSADSETGALAAFFPGRKITSSNAIIIGVHDVVENGAVVPIKVNTELPSVLSITILVEKNPNPLIAHFDLSPECKGFIATRIKIGEPSDVVAVVQSDGQLYATRKFVEVVEGGCN